MSIKRILSNPVKIEEGSIIKVQLKYELSTTSKLSILEDSSIERYVIEFFLKLKGSSVMFPLNSLYHLVSEIILKKYICPVQIKCINWKLMTLTNTTNNNFLVRLPLIACQGYINLPLSKISLDHHYIYHLYHENSTPSKFIVKGIPQSCFSDSSFSDKMNALSSIFMDNLPIIDLDQNNKEVSYFRFVKRVTSKDSSKYKDLSFQEIEAAYPWGFTMIKKYKRPNKKVKRKRKTKR